MSTHITVNGGIGVSTDVNRIGIRIRTIMEIRMCIDVWYLWWYTYYCYWSVSINASRRFNDGFNMGVDMNITGRVCADRFFRLAPVSV